MRIRALIALPAIAVLAACSSGGEAASPTPTVAETTAAEPMATATEGQDAAETSSGPSREGIIKAMADAWGKLGDDEKVQMCADIDLLGGEAMWEALDSPTSISAAEVAAIWADYCRDY